MRRTFQALLPSIAIALAITGASLPTPTRAQTYPIDCAILLCLSGGWPASVPCTRARAEFIRRITPWPVEPPLQIWRCPMGASYETDQQPSNAGRIFEAFSKTVGNKPRQTFPALDAPQVIKSTEAVWRSSNTNSEFAPAGRALRLVQDRADIDISGPEFNFVRTIRVFDVRNARQNDSGRDGECSRGAMVFLGTYGTQGDFSWQLSSTSALPLAHTGLERWGDHCPSIYHRSVFVDWRDYEGNYGFEQVNY